MSKYFAIALVAVVAALVTANVVVAADQTRTQTQTQQRLQDGSCCQNVCDGTCPNPGCPAYQYQYQTGKAYQWAGPEDQIHGVDRDDSPIIEDAAARAPAGKAA